MLALEGIACNRSEMSSNQSKMRIDQFLVLKGYSPTRSRARDMISRQCVEVDGNIVVKAGQMVGPTAEIKLNDPARNYVSRAALKLIAGLDAGNVSVKNRVAVDLGASTGGFTQVLLEREASKVFAIDVGQDQMDARIAEHSRVVNMEKFNARNLTFDDINLNPDVIVSDLSFISLKIAAEPALLLASENAHCVLLVKPQFEVGKDGIGKGGIVQNQDLINSAVAKVKIWFSSLPGWSINCFLPSPIKGGDGNIEYLLCGARNATN